MKSFKLQSVKLHVKTMMSTTIWPHADEEDHKPSSSHLIHGITHLKTALLMPKSLAETTTSHKAAIFSSIQFPDHTRGRQPCKTTLLDANPWRETSKPVYVLTHRENQLCTMKTRRNRSEVERELGLLFSKGGKWRSGIGNQAKQSRTGTKFQMLVEDIREGVLVFEDENEAARYCDLLQGGGKGCEGVAEIEASSVFDLCQKMRALAVLFRRGRTPPLPQSLELNLKAKKRSLEDTEDVGHIEVQKATW
nr:hypothetical protein CFP56_26460 [Quercus suber]